MIDKMVRLDSLLMAVRSKKPGGSVFRDVKIWVEKELAT
jgi:hypothetical protein